MRASLTLVCFLIVLAPSSAAGFCTTESEPTARTSATGVSYTMLLRGDGAQHPGVYYIVNDLCQPSCLISVWVYEESNGVPGLQRYDEFRDDTCGLSWWEPDTLVW